jgi:predicted nucleotidyltransferase
MNSIKQLICEHRNEIMRLAHVHHTDRVRLFGSVASGKNTETSDIDLVVSRLQGFNLMDWVGLTDELSALLGKKVDVVVEDQLRPEIREAVLATALDLMSLPNEG